MNNTINTFLHTEAPINHQQQPVQTDTGIFTPKHDGVYFEGFGRDGQPLPEKRICSLLKVVADTRTVQGNGWGILLEWRDSDNREQRWAMPKRLLSDGGAEIAGELLDRGLWIAPNKRNKVLEYITATRTTKRITCTDRTGWHGQAYVTPERVYGLDGDQYIYQAEGVGIDSIMSTTSTLVDWQNAVARYAVGNARLMFAIATAFAGTLVTPANVESGGFHLVGGSSSGKTTAQRAAASVWGQPDTFKRSWRSTANGLEGIASLHNDNLLILDEISEMNSKDASETAYMLGNGQGKTRSNKNGSTRPTKTWKTLFLSSGEVTLQTLVNEDNGKRRVKAGQEVRIADINADAGKDWGIFESLHHFPSSAALADHLRYATNQHYGTAGIQWLDMLTKHYSQWHQTLQESIAQFCKSVLPPNVSGQANRVARRFGLVAVAGELATQYGITGWQQGQATQAAQHCFNDWLAQFGKGNREDKQIMDAVMSFLERNPARFQDLNLVSPLPVIDRVGFIRNKQGDTEYIIPARQLERLAEGFSSNQIAQVLQKFGLLNEPDKEGKNAIKMRLAELGSIRCYIITTNQYLN